MIDPDRLISELTELKQFSGIVNFSYSNRFINLFKDAASLFSGLPFTESWTLAKMESLFNSVHDAISLLPQQEAFEVAEEFTTALQQAIESTDNCYSLKIIQLLSVLLEMVQEGDSLIVLQQLCKLRLSPVVVVPLAAMFVEVCRTEPHCALAICKLSEYIQVAYQHPADADADADASSSWCPMAADDDLPQLFYHFINIGKGIQKHLSSSVASGMGAGDLVMPALSVSEAAAEAAAAKLQYQRVSALIVSEYCRCMDSLLTFCSSGSGGDRHTEVSSAHRANSAICTLWTQSGLRVASATGGGAMDSAGSGVGVGAGRAASLNPNPELHRQSGLCNSIATSFQSVAVVVQRQAGVVEALLAALKQRVALFDQLKFLRTHNSTVDDTSAAVSIISPSLLLLCLVTAATNPTTQQKIFAELVAIVSAPSVVPTASAATATRTRTDIWLPTPERPASAPDAHTDNIHLLATHTQAAIAKASLLYLVSAVPGVVLEGFLPVLVPLALTLVDKACHECSEARRSHTLKLSMLRTDGYNRHTTDARVVFTEGGVGAVDSRVVFECSFAAELFGGFPYVRGEMLKLLLVSMSAVIYGHEYSGSGSSGSGKAGDRGLQLQILYGYMSVLGACMYPGVGAGTWEDAPPSHPLLLSTTAQNTAQPPPCTWESSGPAAPTTYTDNAEELTNFLALLPKLSLALAYSLLQLVLPCAAHVATLRDRCAMAVRKASFASDVGARKAAVGALTAAVQQILILRSNQTLRISTGIHSSTHGNFGGAVCNSGTGFSIEDCLLTFKRILKQDVVAVRRSVYRALQHLQSKFHGQFRRTALHLLANHLRGLILGTGDVDLSSMGVLPPGAAATTGATTGLGGRGMKLVFALERCVHTNVGAITGSGSGSGGFILLESAVELMRVLLTVTLDEIRGTPGAIPAPTSAIAPSGVGRGGSRVLYSDREEECYPFTAPTFSQVEAGKRVGGPSAAAAPTPGYNEEAFVCCNILFCLCQGFAYCDYSAFGMTLNGNGGTGTGTGTGAGARIGTFRDAVLALLLHSLCQTAITVILMLPEVSICESDGCQWLTWRFGDDCSARERSQRATVVHTLYSRMGDIGRLVHEYQTRCRHVIVATGADTEANKKKTKRNKTVHPQQQGQTIGQGGSDDEVELISASVQHPPTAMDASFTTGQATQPLPSDPLLIGIPPEKCTKTLSLVDLFTSQSLVCLNGSTHTNIYYPSNPGAGSTMDCSPQATAGLLDTETVHTELVVCILILHSGQNLKGGQLLPTPRSEVTVVEGDSHANSFNLERCADVMRFDLYLPNHFFTHRLVLCTLRHTLETLLLLIGDEDVLTGFDSAESGSQGRAAYGQRVAMWINDCRQVFILLLNDFITLSSQGDAEEEDEENAAAAGEDDFTVTVGMLAELSLRVTILCLRVFKFLHATATGLGCSVDMGPNLEPQPAETATATATATAPATTAAAVGAATITGSGSHAVVAIVGAAFQYTSLISKATHASRAGGSSAAGLARDALRLLVGGENTGGCSSISVGPPATAAGNTNDVRRAILPTQYTATAAPAATGALDPDSSGTTQDAKLMAQYTRRFLSLFFSRHAQENSNSHYARAASGATTAVSCLCLALMSEILQSASMPAHPSGSAGASVRCMPLPMDEATMVYRNTLQTCIAKLPNGPPSEESSVQLMDLLLFSCTQSASNRLNRLLTLMQYIFHCCDKFASAHQLVVNIVWLPSAPGATLSLVGHVDKVGQTFSCHKTAWITVLILEYMLRAC